MRRLLIWLWGPSPYLFQSRPQLCCHCCEKTLADSAIEQNAHVHMSMVGHNKQETLSTRLFTLQNTALVTSVSFYALSLFSVLVTESPCDQKTGNWLHKGFKIWYREWLALHWIPHQLLYYNLHAIRLSMLLQVLGSCTLESNILLRLRCNCN